MWLSGKDYRDLESKIERLKIANANLNKRVDHMDSAINALAAHLGGKLVYREAGIDFVEEDE